MSRTPQLQPHIPELPFSGGLVGSAGYDTVRYFERLPNPPQLTDDPRAPEAAFLAPESLLVFDHLTRRIALLHAGQDTERKDLRGEVRRLLAGPMPKGVERAKLGPVQSSLSADEFMRPWNEATLHCQGRHLPTRAIGSIRRTARARAVRDVSCTAIVKSFSLHVFL